MDTGQLFMIPCPIVEGHLDTLPKETIDTIHNLSYFLVERARTTRRFIKSTGHPKAISELKIFELDKNNPDQGMDQFLNHLKQGISIGVISEAGCPGIADPGHRAVQYAHSIEADVVPLVGPSSIFLALMASGLNGQNFSFNGYLPNKSGELVKKLRSIEQLAVKQNQTQIFMEAPYRNAFILEHSMKAFSPQTSLCIACDIGSKESYIRTKKVKDWKGTDWKQFHKRPAILMIGR